MEILDLATIVLILIISGMVMASFLVKLLAMFGGSIMGIWDFIK